MMTIREDSDEIIDKNNYKNIKKHWYTIQELVTYLINVCKTRQYEKIVELGPGKIPFPISTHLVDRNQECLDNARLSNKILYNLDLNTQKIDADDNYFDFCYARHIFEDVQNPDFMFENITKQCKMGYIETPSPLIECMKYVDSVDESSYRGYHHHRYIVWTENNQLHFLPKMPIIEYISIDPEYEKTMYELAKNPFYWNNYYVWDKEEKYGNTNLPKCVMHEYSIETYSELLMHAIKCSIEHTNNNIFISKTQ